MSVYNSGLNRIWKLIAWSAALGCLSLVSGIASGAPGGNSMNSTGLRPVIQNGHTSGVNGLAFSPAEDLLVSASSDQTLKLWDSNGRLLGDFTGHKNRVLSVAFHPGGKMIVSGSKDKSVKLWDLQGNVLREFKGHKSAVNAVVFSPDGKNIVSGSGDGTLRIWSTGGQLIKILKIKKAYGLQIRSVVFSPDGLLIAAGANNMYGRRKHTIQIWKRNGELVRSFAGPKLSTQINALAFSPDGKTIAAASGGWVGIGTIERSVKLWSLDGKLLKDFGRHKNTLTALLFRPDGKQLIVASEDGHIYYYHPRDGLISKRRAHRSQIRALAYGPGRRVLASAAASFFGQGTAIAVWDRRGVKQAAFPGRSSTVTGITYNARHGTIAVGLGWPAMAIKIWGLDGRLIRTLRGHTSDVSELAYQPGGDLLISCGRDGTAKFWDPDGNLIRTLPLGALCYGIAFAPDGAHFATALSDHTVRLWDGKGNLKGIFRGHLGNVYSVAFSPDGQRLVSAGEDKTVRIWSRKGKGLSLLHAGGSVSNVVFSPDGAAVLYGMSRREQIILRRADGKILHSFKGSTFKYHPRSGGLVTTAADGQIRFFHPRTYKGVDKIAGIGGALDFSPKSNRMFVGGWDHTTNIWNLNNKAHVSLLSSGVDWIMYTSDGYFDSSPSGGRLVSMVRGLEAFAIDQFALKLNRPDRILRRLKGYGTELLEHYRRQYERRLKRMKVTNNNQEWNAPPRVQILSHKKKGKFLSLKIAVNDRRHKILGYSAYVNGVTVLSVRKKNLGRKFRRTLGVALAGGTNRVEVSAINAKGIESYRAFVHVAHQVPGQADLYFVGFGVSSYADSNLNLGYAHKDALDLKSAFKAMSGKGRFKRVFTRTFVNQKANIKSFKQARRFLARARVNDTVVVFIAGHGLYERRKEARYYFLTHEAKLDNLSATAVSFGEIEDLLASVQSRQRLLLMDTCESGEVDSSVQNEYYTQASRRGIRARTTRGIKVVLRPGQRPPGPRNYLYQKDRYIYNDLLRRTGAIVFSSSKGGEFSYESNEIKNGFFTAQIMIALTSRRADTNQDGNISTLELRNFVTRGVRRQTDGLQNPTVDRDNIHQRIIFPLVESRTNSSSGKKRHRLEAVRVWLNKDGQPYDLKTLSRLKNLTLLGRKITQKQLNLIAGLQNLRSLSLAYTPLTGLNLKAITKLKNLRHLNLKHTKLSRSQLCRLRDLKELRTLDIAGAKINTDDIACLKNFTDLISLSLRDIKITDRRLKPLRGMRKMESLDLTDTRIGDKGLVYIKSMNKLKSLRLSENKITDKGLKHLRRFTALQSLYLRATKVTDKGLPGLGAFQHLRGLDVRNTKVSVQGADALAASRPGLFVRRYKYQKGTR